MCGAETSANTHQNKAFFFSFFFSNFALFLPPEINASETKTSSHEGTKEGKNPSERVRHVVVQILYKEL